MSFIINTLLNKIFVFKISVLIVIILTSLVGIIAIYYVYFQLLRSTKLGNKLPGLPPVPILGNALEFINKDPKGNFFFIQKLTKV